MTTLRILILIHRLFDSSPYSFFVREQARALAEAGHEVVVIAPVWVLPGQRFLRPAAAQVARATPAFAFIDEIPVHYPRLLALGDVGARLLGGRLIYHAALPIARRLHRQQPFDLIHAHMLPMEGHAALLLGKKLGIPVALTVHGTDVIRYFKPGEQPWPRNRRIAGQVGALMAVSSMLANLVQPYRKEPIPVVSNGVDLSLVPATHANYPRRLVSGGTLKARKCMHTTLDAFIALAADFPDATLTIFGEGPDRAALQEKITAHGLETRVTLTGSLPHQDVLQLMADSDAFILPSYAEGQGVVYIEAMAAGCLAVGAEKEGIADVITDGVNGFLVPAANVQALIPVMRRILEGGADLAAIRQRGEADARALTWARNAAACTEIYQHLLAQFAHGGGNLI